MNDDRGILQDLLGRSPSPRRRHAVSAALTEASKRFPGENHRGKRAAFVLGALWYRGNGMADYPRGYQCRPETVCDEAPTEHDWVAQGGAIP
jgi:hypothetical protein